MHNQVAGIRPQIARQRGHWGRPVPGICLVLLMAATATAAPIFSWVDKSGDLHVTDQLFKVPEPFYSMYAAELRRRQEARGSKAGTKTVADSAAERPAAKQSSRQGGRILRQSGPTGLASRIQADRARWKKLVQDWRVKLREATERVGSIDREIQVAASNPMLRHTPRVKKQVKMIEVRRRSAVSAVEAARLMLVTELPRKARKEGVPPGWLR